MTDFKALEIVRYPTVGQKITKDTQYWKRLGFPVACKEYGSIDFVDIATEEPHNVAVTCSSKVQIYSSVDNKVQSSLSRFKKSAYGGVFRGDGKLLAAGSEDGYVRLFEVKSRNVLRIFKGHKAAVHRCKFTRNGTRIATFSDDKSVGLWDIPTESRILNIEEHTDYVQAGAISLSAEDIFLSGSYDHTVKMYDARTSSAILSVDHGAPVESVVMFPTGGIFLSAGGTSVKVWDRIAGRLLAQVTQHHKTVTSLCFASDGRRLMSGSLDRHVKIYDVMTYQVVHTLDYPSPILSVASSPGDAVVVVGMVDGLMSIRHQGPEAPSEKQEKTTHRNKIRYQSKLYGTDFMPTDNDIVVPEFKKRVLRSYDRHLKSFNSTRALDEVLRPAVQRRLPETTVSVMMELIHRRALRAAMAGREGENLRRLLRFVTTYLRDPRFTRVLVDVGLMLVDLYGPKLSNPMTKNMFAVLVKAVNKEVEYMKEMMEVQGILQGILAVAHSNDVPEECPQIVNGHQESGVE